MKKRKWKNNDDLSKKERRELALNIRTKLSKNQQHSHHYKALSDNEVDYIQGLITADLMENKAAIEVMNTEDKKKDLARVFGYLKHHSKLNKETVCKYLSSDGSIASELLPALDILMNEIEGLGLPLNNVKGMYKLEGLKNTVSKFCLYHNDLVYEKKDYKWDESNTDH